VHDLRDVVDLRTQFQCEYRLYLQQRHGETQTEAASIGAWLHETQSSMPKHNPIYLIAVTAVFALFTLATFILWFLW
jgi:hypothetical protein